MIAHPCLYATEHQLDIARRNIARYEWAKEAYEQIRLEADKLKAMELPKFERAWWHEAKKRPWQENYPEINLHTGSAVRPAIYAAMQSALIYALGGEEAYGERAKRVLMHYSDYSFEFEHPDVGLNYSSWGIQAFYTYDLLYDRFTTEERAKIDAFFERMAMAVLKNDEWWIAENLGGKFNNHYAWHKSLMAIYGLFYEKPEWVERALNGKQGIRELMEHGFLDDGIWFESSLNYHYTALQGLIMLAWSLRNAGYPLDLFNHEFANGRTLEQGFSGMLQVLFPDMTIPQIGDTYGQTVYLPDAGSYEPAWVVYPSPVYDWLISEKRGQFRTISLFREEKPSVGEPPAVTSRIFPEHGHVILRSIEGRQYWKSDSWAAFVSYDLDSVHSHRDKLGLILFGRGKLLAPDANALATVPHAFSAKVSKELNHSTICHNTLMVDRRDHSPIPEKLSLIEFKALPSVKTVTVGDLKGIVYPGVRMQRTIAVTQEYVLDVFQATSEEEHSYQWLFHTNDDEGETRTTVEFKPIEIPSSPPWCWLRNSRLGRTDADWQAEWHQGEVRFRLSMVGVPGTEITLFDFPKNDKLEGAPTAMLMAERHGKHQIFTALYQAEKGDIPTADILAIEDDEGMLRVRVTIGRQVREHLIPRLR